MNSDWYEYYSNVDKPKIEEETLFSGLKYDSNNYTLSPNKGNTYIYNCYFHGLSNDYGGAISYAITNSNILIEQCSFLYCQATRDTAAIRITGGNVIMVTICGQYNEAIQRDAFCAINTDSDRTINSVIDSSVSYCEADDYHMMYHYAGFIHIKSLNISHNNVGAVSAIEYRPTICADESEFGSIINFCSFSNNTAENQCIYPNNQNNNECKHQIKNSNIIENNSPNTKGETMIKKNMYFKSWKSFILY